MPDHTANDQTTNHQATHDRDWNEKFALRLRTLGVSGAEVGDALKTVQTHCAESGETPSEAFGDPRRYAESLGSVPRSTSTDMLLAIPLYLGLTLGLRGIRGTIADEAVGFTIWDISALLGLGVFAFVISRILTSVRNPWPWLSVAFIVYLAAAVGFAALEASPLVEVEATLVSIVGVGLVIPSVLALIRVIRRNRIADPIDGHDMISRHG